MAQWMIEQSKAERKYLGKRVIINNLHCQRSPKYEATQGIHGRVVHVRGFDSIGVKLDNYPENKAASSGCYYYEACELQFEFNERNKERNDMVKLTGYKKVAVINYNGQVLHYALYNDDLFQVGDKVLVTGKLNGKILVIDKIITLEEAYEEFSKTITEEVITVVDTSLYDQRLENRARAVKIKSDMDKKIKELDEFYRYQMYAEKNPELAELLAEYKELME